MPIYEYKCESCGHCFECLVFAGDDPATECPQCCGKNIQQQISVTSCISKSGIGSCVSAPDRFS